MFKDITTDKTKLIEECFSNIKILSYIWPEDVMPIIVSISQSHYFVNKSSINFDADAIRTIYFNWISTIKVVVKD